MTSKARFDQLANLLPTVVPEDTDDTKREVAVFRKMFIELCPTDACGVLR